MFFALPSWIPTALRVLRWFLLLAAVGNLHMGDADRQRLEEQLPAVTGAQSQLATAECASHRFPPGPGRIATWDGAQPALRRGDDGLARRVDRLRCLGNAVVPQQAALAFRELAARKAVA